MERSRSWRRTRFRLRGKTVMNLLISTFGAYDYYNARIPSYNCLDLEATWNVNKILQIRAGANYVLDKDPPIINTDIVAGAQRTPTAPMICSVASCSWRSRRNFKRPWARVISGRKSELALGPLRPWP
jgi:hypothetical protein